MLNTTLRGRSAAFVLLVALTALPWVPASAHSALIASTPRAGSTIDRLPDRVELRFNDELSDIGPALILRRGRTTVARLEPQVDGRVLRASAPQDLDDGGYVLVWRVVSGDGHPIDGGVPFRLGASGATAPEQAPVRTGTERGAGFPVAIALAIGAPALLLVGLGVRSLRRRPS